MLMCHALIARVWFMIRAMWEGALQGGVSKTVYHLSQTWFCPPPSLPSPLPPPWGVVLQRLGMSSVRIKCLGVVGRAPPPKLPYPHLLTISFDSSCSQRCFASAWCMVGANVRSSVIGKHFKNWFSGVLGSSWPHELPPPRREPYSAWPHILCSWNMTGVFLASFMIMEWKVSWRYRLALINNITNVHRLAASRGDRGVLI